MVNWKKISFSLFILGILGLLLSLFYSLIQMTAMYAPPDMMAAQNAKNGQEFLLIVASLGIIFLSSLVSFMYGKRQEKSLSPPEEQ